MTWKVQSLRKQKSTNTDERHRQNWGESNGGETV